MEVMNEDQAHEIVASIEDGEVGPGEDPGKNYWAVILLALCVFVVFGNVLVITVVATNQVQNFSIDVFWLFVSKPRLKRSFSCLGQALG